MIEKIIEKILDQFNGVNLWIVLIVAAMSAVACLWVGAKKTEKKTLKRKIVIGVAAIFIVLTCLGGHEAYRRHEYTFPEGTTGILVLHLVGDGDSSLQTALVAELDNRLADAKIKVRSYPLGVDESLGLEEAHKAARKIGKKFNALLVIWGNSMTGKFIQPRITIVKEEKVTGLKGNHQLGSIQNITELALPQESIETPIFLAQFALGYSCYKLDEDEDALAHFEAALALSVSSSDELADLKLYAATTLCYLAPRQTNQVTYLSRAIGYFEQAAGDYQKRNENLKLAKTQNNLGVAYAELPTGDRAQNLSQAITCFQAALRVRTETAYPADWAATQNNLGAVYSELPTGDRAENLGKAKVSLLNALKIYTEKDYPEYHRGVAGNLAAVESELAKLARK